MVAMTSFAERQIGAEIRYTIYGIPKPGRSEGGKQAATGQVVTTEI
jgi:hypothetical protein